MSGLLAAIKLREAGHEFTIFEKAAKVGGTWRENTYPGIACDVPSHLYSYSFDLNPDWHFMSSPGAEILTRLEDLALAGEPEWLSSNFISGPRTMPVRFRAAAR